MNTEKNSNYSNTPTHSPKINKMVFITRDEQENRNPNTSKSYSPQKKHSPYLTQKSKTTFIPEIMIMESTSPINSPPKLRSKNNKYLEMPTIMLKRTLTTEAENIFIYFINPISGSGYGKFIFDLNVLGIN